MANPAQDINTNSLRLKGRVITSEAFELNILDGAIITTKELNTLKGITVTATELNNAADVSARVQELTISGAVTTGVQSVELNHISTIIASTVAAVIGAHDGMFIVKNTSESGTAAHTCTLTGGTWDGSNTIITLNAPNEAIMVYFDSAGDGTIIENVGAVALS